MGGARHGSGWFGLVFGLVFGLGVVSCSLLVSFDDFGTTARTASPEAGAAETPYSVHGVASGLEGKSVTLLMKIHPAGAPMQVERTARDLQVGEGEFVFASALADGERYEVTIRENPAGLSCSVDRGTGVIARSDVAGVLVNCASSDALLADLQVSGLPISPVFAPGVFSYEAKARAYDVFTTSLPSATIVATAKHAGASVFVAGVPTVSGDPSAPLPLKSGRNLVSVVVVAPDQRQLHYVVSIDLKVCDYFKPSDNPTSGEFGASIAISGSRMAVGSAKVVHVFARSGRVWSHEALLQPNPTLQTAGHLAVALAGDTLVVGSPDDAGIGAAYVFTRTGTTWMQVGYLTASNARVGARFGGSVAVSADTIAVGSESESSSAIGIDGDQTDTSAPGAGAVYVFKRSGAVWSQQAYVKASDTLAGAAFGSAVALEADTLAVGAPTLDSGAAYVFVRAGATWSQQFAPGLGAGVIGEDGAVFGRTISLSGNTLAVGAERSRFAGEVFVYVRSGATWSFEARLSASTGSGDDFKAFGSGVALEGDTLAVGAMNEESGETGLNAIQGLKGAPRSGAAYRYVRVGTTWSRQAYVKAPNTRQDARFGSSVALSAGVLAVGSPGETSIATGINGDETTGTGPAVGAAYVY
jgi:hypothetical protein